MSALRFVDDSTESSADTSTIKTNGLFGLASVAVSVIAGSRLLGER